MKKNYYFIVKTKDTNENGIIKAFASDNEAKKYAISLVGSNVMVSFYDPSEWHDIECFNMFISKFFGNVRFSIEL